MSTSGGIFTVLSVIAHELCFYVAWAAVNAVRQVGGAVSDPTIILSKLGCGPVNVDCTDARSSTTQRLGHSRVVALPNDVHENSS
jgi:hypothetical protein